MHSTDPSELKTLQQLGQLVDQLLSIVDRLDRHPEDLPSSTLEDQPISSAQALQIRAERQRLIQSWAQLEAEQREQALQQALTHDQPAAPLPMQRTENQQEQGPSSETWTTDPATELDSSIQFELLQQEYNRYRD